MGGEPSGRRRQHTPATASTNRSTKHLRIWETVYDAAGHVRRHLRSRGRFGEATKSSDAFVTLPATSVSTGAAFWSTVGIPSDLGRDMGPRSFKNTQTHTHMHIVHLCTHIRTCAGGCMRLRQVWRRSRVARIASGATNHHL